MNQIEQNRRFMHCPSFKEGMAQSDQSKEVPAPPFGREPKGATIVLPSFEGVSLNGDYLKLLDTRRSKRKYDASPMSQEQLAFILWSVQGMQEIRGGGVATLRPVPSGGARHPFETYITVKNVTGLEPGIYLYHPAVNIGEKVCTIEKMGDFPGDEKISEMLAGQRWACDAPVVFFYSCVPYKAEWRYVNMAHRVMLIDLGHLGQNAMLSAEALGLGSCCMAAFDQSACDAVLGLDGIDEYMVYAISVGKPLD